MAYGYRLIENKQDSTIDILEKLTNFVITAFQFTEREKAKELYNHLNFGGAFDGNTPSFFLIKTPSYINKVHEADM